MVTAAITSIGVAVPSPIDQAAIWEDFFQTHFAGARGAGRIFRHAGVQQRHAAVVPTDEDLSMWGTEARMRRFVAEALPLGRQAVCAALECTQLDPAQVDQLTVVTCTGYATPGLDVQLASELGLPATAQRVQIGHMGCYAAIPGLATVADAAVARGLTSILLCVELPSLHLQPPTDEIDQIVAHALFGDAAAAVVVEPRSKGLVLLDVAARTDASHADEMKWDITDHGFRMALSPKIPEVLAQHVSGTVTALLDRHGLRVADVAHWAVHPGGPKIIDVVEDRLGLDGELEVSRQVLQEYGNCSSPTVLIILERLVRETGIAPGDHVVMLAFGPGLTLYAALLRCAG